jgi:putative ABC transport system permease protein
LQDITAPKFTIAEPPAAPAPPGSAPPEFAEPGPPRRPRRGGPPPPDRRGRMMPLSTLFFALRALRDNRMRSALTALGIIIGVGAVVAAVSVGQGAGATITDQIGQLGNNLLFIVPSNPKFQPGEVTGVTQSLRIADAEAILERCKKTVAKVSPAVRGSVLVRRGNNNTRTTLSGVTAAYFLVNNSPVRLGRAINEVDDSLRSRVVVLGPEVVKTLYGDEFHKCLGDTVAINRVRYTIVGVLDRKGAFSFGDNQDDVVIIPLTTALNRVLNQRSLSFVSVECRTADSIPLAQEQIVALLRQRHRLSPPFPDNDDFNVLSQTALLDVMKNITGILTALLASIAGISLTVGGIGIMNIMLVSVTERTREIGIRKALGATEGNIRSQFLIEAAMLSVAGGIIGVLIGGGISFIAAKISTWKIEPNLTSVAVAVGVSAAIGIFFGYWPARKAAQLHPIEALRRE